MNAWIEEDALWLEPESVDTTEVDVAATDSGGLRATQRFRVWTAPAPDPDAFHIEVHFESGFTAEEEATVLQAADRWMEVVTGDLPDMPVRGTLGDYCRDRGGPRLVGVVDDLLIRMEMHPTLNNAMGNYYHCARRMESGHDVVAVNRFNQWYVQQRGLDHLYEVALHEIGHALGIRSTWPVQDRDTDPHFAGPLAVAAFDAAGGVDYPGGKVPVELPGNWGPRIHWRRSVIPDDVMSVGAGSLVTAISLQALADLGHVVDLTRADPYVLPASVQGAVWPGLATVSQQAQGRETFICEVGQGPVLALDAQGRVARAKRP